MAMCRLNIFPPPNVDSLNSYGTSVFWDAAPQNIKTVEIIHESATLMNNLGKKCNIGANN